MKKQSVYCNPLDYFDAVYPDFYQAIKAACVSGSFGSLRGTTDGGKTLVVPTKKALAAIRDKLESSDVEEFKGVAEILNSYVLRVPCATPAQMKDASDAGTLVNGAFKPRTVAIGSVTSAKVTLANGAVLSPNKDFKCTRGYFVWTMESGEMPMDGAENAPAIRKKSPFAPKPVMGEGEKKNKSRGGKKRGAYEFPSTGIVPKFRREIATFVESRYFHEAGVSGKNALIECATSLCFHLLQADREFYHDMIGHSLTCSESDFYMLVEPDNFCGYFRVPEEMLREWWAKACKTSGSLAAECAALEAAFADFARSPDCAVYDPAARSKLVTAVNAAREMICETADTDGRNIATRLTEVYDAFIRTNSIGDVTNVLPERCIEYYRGHHGLKLLQDCARYGTHFALESRPTTFQQCHAAFNAIGDAWYMNDTDAMKYNPIVNKLALTYSIGPEQAVTVAKMFACSTCFLFYSMSPAEIANFRLRNSEATPDPEGKPTIHNILAAGRKTHDRLIGESSAELAKSMTDFLDHVDANNIPAGMKQVLDRIKRGEK